MLQVAIGALLLIAGMVGLFALSALGVPAIAAGYLLIRATWAGQTLQGAFFGLALLGLAAPLLQFVESRATVSAKG
ncbi:hypothetical protein NA655_13735 [Pseudomonas kuykendallii]|uniref:Uncharacterized protein n=1 Tax=Pseudomonas kuykendallii TaxID=1007099 RepID=A0A1H2ZYP2_9PSED|nr:hypothetical protein [Pseudomonas kuykendallii]MCQ4272084.1 hypothetical protein [Pseudomonas kuykendallii]SDX22453.1 hypothetical protein SAMN05216287_2505 [Pseudomonas kuykendallii]